VVAIALGLASCGGGGGDSGSTAPGVTVNAPSTTSIKTEVLEGSTAPNVVLSGTVSGDPNSLSGRSVYVVVEDPASLFESNGVLQLQQSGGVWQYSLNLTGRALVTTGRRTGTLRVFVCLDPGCSTRLNGTPIAIPFDVNVVPAMVLSTHTVSVTVPFGTVPPEQSVDIALSSFSSTWLSNDDEPFNPALIKTLQLVEGNQWNSGTQLKFRLTPAIPGTYTERISVLTQATISPGQSRDYLQYIDITYTVTPNDAIDHVFDPASLSITHSLSNLLAQQHPYQLYTNFGTSVQSYGGVTYDPSPVSSSTGAFIPWWNDSQRTSFPCIGTVGVGGLINYDCLAPGVYTARVLYQLSGINGTEVVEFPITMTVTP